MIQLHVSGRLGCDPAQKTSANGKPYVHAMLVASTTDGDQGIKPSVVPMTSLWT